jgi:hypothetical protein
VRIDRGTALYFQDDVIAPMADGSLIVAAASKISKLTPTGATDATFQATGAIGGCWASDLAVDSSDRVVIAISSGCIAIPPNDVVVRLSATGTRDAGFSGRLVGALTDTRIVSVTDAIVVSGVGSSGACLFRFRQTDGELDTTFGPMGTPGRFCLPLPGGGRTRAIVRSDGGFTLLAVGTGTATLAQIAASGTLEGTSHAVDLGSSSVSVSDMVGMTADGVLIVGTDVAFPSRLSLQRVDAVGALVPAFNPSGAVPGRKHFVSDNVQWSIARFAAGRFVLAGAVAGAARAIMIDEFGNSDLALDPTGPIPGAMTVTPSAPSTFSRFTDVATSLGRVVAIGPEGSGSQFQEVANAAVVARGDLVGPRQVADTALFRPTQPTRLLDTRPGPNQVGYSGPKPVAGATVELQIAGRAGMPAEGIGAVALNLTATEASAPGFVTAWPSGSPRPVVSSLNLERADQTIPNLVVVPVGSNGRVSVFTLSGTHLIADVFGWFPSAGALHAVQPERLLDTRPGPTRIGYVGDKPVERSTVELQVSGRAGLPQTGVQVAVLNVTMTETEAPGFVTVWPSGSARPMTSNLNASVAGQTIPNFVMVPVGPNGKINLFTFAGSHLLVDIVGWLPPHSGYVPTPASPSPRVLDTRGNGGAPLPPVAAGSSVTVPGAGVQLVNVVATDTRGPGFVTIFPNDTSMPTASNLNIERVGQTIANAALVNGSSTGYRVFTLSSTHLVIDSFGRFPSEE